MTRFVLFQLVISFLITTNSYGQIVLDAYASENELTTITDKIKITVEVTGGSASDLKFTIFARDGGGIYGDLIEIEDYGIYETEFWTRFPGEIKLEITEKKTGAQAVIKLEAREPKIESDFDASTLNDGYITITSQVKDVRDEPISNLKMSIEFIDKSTMEKTTGTGKFEPQKYENGTYRWKFTPKTSGQFYIKITENNHITKPSSIIHIPLQ